VLVELMRKFVSTEPPPSRTPEGRRSTSPNFVEGGWSTNDELAYTCQMIVCGRLAIQLGDVVFSLLADLPLSLGRPAKILRFNHD
jgi:hypothetical protein